MLFDIFRPHIKTEDEIYLEFIERRIAEFRHSAKFKEMLAGERYYEGRHDILRRERTAIGEGGKPVVVENVPNNRIADNQYKKLVRQKVDYLVGKPIVFHSGDAAYDVLLKKIFGKKFLRLFRAVAEDSLNCGLGFVYVYADENGKLCFQRFKPYEVIPGWADEEHTKLDYLIRLYEIIFCEGKKNRIVTKVELYEKGGIRFFELKNGRLIPEKRADYLTDGERGYNFEEIPVAVFRYNDKEIPLLRDVRSLQDALNTVLSNFQNGMEEDARNTILVIRNYDGEDLGEFRRNLAVYGAVKVRTVDGTDGGVETLNIEVNAENYKVVAELLKKALIENGRGFDASVLKSGGSPNRMNIQSIFSDIDLDANGMENEYRAGFEQLLYFVDIYLENAGYGSFNGDVDVIFNRDMLIDESGIIEDCVKSQGLISVETIVKNHPWVNDVEKELEALKGNV